MSCSKSSSESLADLDYGPCGRTDCILMQLNHGFNQLGMVLYAVAVTNHWTHFNVQDQDDNILLHISVRIDLNVVVFNTLRNGCWEQEERPSKMPVIKDKKYNLLIAYECEGYRVYINGEEFYFFKHRINNPATLFRMPFGKIYSVSYKRNEPKWAIQRPVKEINCEIDTPHEIELQECGPLSWIQIYGTVKCNANRFDVNLMNSCREILFHFNPRFGEFCVVRNSCIGGWGTEERNGGIPFIEKQKFVLVIVVQNNCYKTYVNGEEFITFNHRVPANVARLLIENDIKIHKIMYHK